MITGYDRVSTTKQNLGLQHDDLKPAFDASVDPADAHNTRRDLVRLLANEESLTPNTRASQW